MYKPRNTILIKIILLIFVIIFFTKNNLIFAQHTVNDTVVVGAVIYKGDTLEAKTLENVTVNGVLTQAQKNAYAAWTRLRNAVYVTYPYAKRAGLILNDINAHLQGVTDKAKRKEYIKSRENDLKREFTTPLTNLSIYQGKVLMKLINRETGNSCFQIISEYKGGFTAGFYQTVAFFFSTSLKQDYDALGQDAEIEKIVKEVERMYGYKS